MKRIIKRSQEEEPRISPSVREEIEEYLYRISEAMEVISKYLGSPASVDTLAFHIEAYPVRACLNMPKEVYEEFIKLFSDITGFSEYYYEILDSQLRTLMTNFKNKYSWISNWYQVGKGGGWLCVETESIEQLWNLEENVLEVEFESLSDYDLIYLLQRCFPHLDFEPVYGDFRLLEEETLKLENIAKSVKEIDKVIKGKIQELESPEFWIEELKALKEE